MKTIVYVIQYRKDGKWVDFDSSKDRATNVAVMDVLDKLFHDRFRTIRRSKDGSMNKCSINELNPKRL